MERRHHALDTARNILNSKIGKALLDDNKFPDRELRLKLQRIDNERKQQRALSDNDQRLFKHKGLVYNYAPTLVVERPSSPVHYQSVLKDYVESETTPHYMTKLKRHKPQAYIPMATVDAFKVIKQRKRNIWESNYSSKDLNEKFRSIIMKSPPLTSMEKADLNTGWSAYRPKSRRDEIINQKLKEKSSRARELAKTTKPRNTSMAFITELGEDNFQLEDINGRTKKMSGDRVMASILVAQSKLVFNPKTIHRFERLRDKQRMDYHKFIR